jgi:hypothetical protein
MSAIGNMYDNFYTEEKMLSFSFYADTLQTDWVDPLFYKIWVGNNYNDSPSSRVIYKDGVSNTTLTLPPSVKTKWIDLVSQTIDKINNLYIHGFEQKLCAIFMGDT